ncbi:MAG TPA: hypothetical protein VK631_08635 [Solirubrobacteraceae bacterium]|nr:hypothetical protein [Solirubrobacteraceae bacterium]
MPVIKQDSLPFSRNARELVGQDHGAGVCLSFVDAPPGEGPSLHKHVSPHFVTEWLNE